MIRIAEVATRAQRKAFIEFPLKLYKGNDCFVPPLYGDEQKLFRPDYHYYDTSEAVYYLAVREGEVVGRISGILQRASNEKWGQKRVRFTRFDCIDDNGILQKCSYGTPMGRETQDFYREIPIHPMPYGQAMAMLFLMEALD